MLAQGPSSSAQQPSLVGNSIIGAAVWVRPPYASGTYASLASQLSATNASARSSLVQIRGVQGLSKIGVRGNGKCEIGELPSADNAGE